MPESGPKHVVIFGTESTGKTMLAEKLAKHFGAPWSEEFVREFWDLHDGKITPIDLGTIALGQMANEDRATAAAKRVVFHDTDMLTCTLWDDVLFPGDCPRWVRGEAELRAKDVALWLVCDTDIPFAPDPQRSFTDPADRAHARQLWRDALEKRLLPFVEIRGREAEREATAIAAVEKIL